MINEKDMVGVVVGRLEELVELKYYVMVIVVLKGVDENVEG
ncbi:hypothetical protein [Staphylococcus saprophyticus]|nr:hypothetical protein [Staphylococcus saprophyticus]